MSMGGGASSERATHIFHRESVAVIAEGRSLPIARAPREGYASACASYRCRAPIHGDARQGCAVPSQATGPAEVGRRLGAGIFRKAREPFIVGVEWTPFRVPRLIRSRAAPPPPAFRQ